MKSITLLLVLTSFFVGSYTVSGVGFLGENEDKEESFDKFFKEFCQSAKFQVQRIKFPLKVVVVDEEKRNEKSIRPDDWRHTNLLKLRRGHPKNTLETVDKGTDLKDVVFTNKDTGEVVHHLFTKIDNLWYLTSIVDESE